MTIIAAFEAKTKFSELLDRVERGEEIIVTRHGKRVARIIPDEANREIQADDLLRRFMAVREGLRAKGVSWTVDEIIEAKNEGRR
jgi:prevent-host-death family protein